MAGATSNVCKDSTCGTRTFHPSGYCKAHRLQQTFQLTASIKKTQLTSLHTKESLGKTLTEALTVGGLHILSLSVREGLPIGARELPTGQVESLSARLQHIADFLEDVDESEGLGEDESAALVELQSLLKDVKQAEGAA